MGGIKVKQETFSAGKIAQEGNLGSANPEAYKPAEKGGQNGGLGGL